MTTAPADALANPSARTTGRPLVSLRRISKIFSNGTLALKDLSLDIAQGEFLSLLGPSGCGKSTALRIIADLGEPTSGTVEWPSAAHYDAAGHPEREIGFVFQEPTLMPWATVFKNVWLPLRLKGMSQTAARADVMEALAMVGLDRFADAYPRELSGGMKMRASLARALVTDPDILLLDEPFAALDEITRFRLNNDLLTLWRELRKTVVFVTHSVFEYVFLSQRVIVMTTRPGRIFAERRIVAPEPRDENFRTSSSYAGFCREMSALLAQASAEKSGRVV